MRVEAAQWSETWEAVGYTGDGVWQQPVRVSSKATIIIMIMIIIIIVIIIIAAAKWRSPLALCAVLHVTEVCLIFFWMCVFDVSCYV